MNRSGIDMGALMAPLSAVWDRASVQRLPGGWLRLFGMVAVLAVSLVFLGRELDGIDLVAVGERLGSVPVTALILGVAATCISYLAVGFYDVLAFRQMRVAVRTPDAVRVGVAATALTQTIGFGPLIGTMVRWRMHRASGISPARAGLLSVLVTLGFFGGAAVLVALLALNDPSVLAGPSGASESVVATVAGAVLCAALGLLVLAQLRPDPSLFGHRLRLPPPRILLSGVALAACDLVPAALVLYLMLPEGVAFATFVPIYCVALVAGLLSNAPGGIGVFEVTLFAALPGVPEADLLAALILYRLIYQVLPFLVALVLIADQEVAVMGGARPLARLSRGARSLRRGVGREPAVVLPAARAGQVPSPVWRLLNGSARAEAQLAYLGDKDFLMAVDGAACLMVREAGGSLIAMGDPIGPRSAWPGLFADFLREARRRLRHPVIYRAGPEAAAVLARFGLKSDRIGHEAVVDAASFSLDGAERRELRRKCRQAEQAGVTILAHAPGLAPLDRLAGVSALWQADRGAAETGFSMGRFLPGYLDRFPVLEARGKDGATIAFLSVWSSGDGVEQSIDLMRVRPDAPQGTMHALISAAILAAGKAGAQRFSLCMAPMSGLSQQAPRMLERIGAWAFQRMAARHGAPGLQRFKQAFRPEWEARFLISRAALLPLMQVLDVRRAITTTPEVAATADVSAQDGFEPVAEVVTIRR